VIRKSFYFVSFTVLLLFCKEYNGEAKPDRPRLITQPELVALREGLVKGRGQGDFGVDSEKK
jgi:hypothetical protein